MGRGVLELFAGVPTPRRGPILVLPEGAADPSAN